jgi:hypothetical protein
MADQLSSAQSLSTGELERLKEVAVAGHRGVLKPAVLRGVGYSRLVKARYVTVRPAGLEAYSYVITERGRRALAEHPHD